VDTAQTGGKTASLPKMQKRPLGPTEKIHQAAKKQLKKMRLADTLP
jgi:hypothetical protein